MWKSGLNFVRDSVDYNEPKVIANVVDDATSDKMTPGLTDRPSEPREIEAASNIMRKVSV